MKLGGLLFAASALTVSVTTAADEELKKIYPGPWRHEFNFGITRALTVNEVSGCGSFKYRESSEDKGEYLVYCTSDLKNWTAYLVWPSIEKVVGPAQPDESLD